VAKKVKKATKKKAASPKKKAAVKKVTAKKVKTKKVAAKKKTAVKKAPAVKKKRVLKKRPRTTLSAAEIEHFKDLLLAKRAELVGDVNSIEKEALRKSRLDAAGDLSSMPIHMADMGTDNFEQEFALGLMDGERKLLGEINDALRRIEQKLYSICEGTGKVIAKARLEANPWARYCIEYATMVEKGLVTEGEKVFDEDHLEEDYDIIEEFYGENEPEITGYDEIKEKEL